jgi:trk/ktr system potassium uptake protein
VKAVIVGCGRVGALIAATLDATGYEVIIIDLSTLAFDRLPEDFKGTAIRGNGTDEAVLRRAGVQNADLFLALTEGDNRNVMSAQIAAEVFDARRVIAKVNDPVRAEAYAELGIATICRTNLMTDAVLEYVGLPTSGAPGVRLPAGQHPGGTHLLPGSISSAETAVPKSPGAGQEGS